MWEMQTWWRHGGDMVETWVEMGHGGEMGQRDRERRSCGEEDIRERWGHMG